VREKSCAFLNFLTEQVAEAVHGKLTTLAEAPPEVRGKALTVNYAKARPCTEGHLDKIVSGGARRKLRVIAPAALTAQQVRATFGGKSESILACDDEELSEAERLKAVAAAAEAKARMAAKAKAESAESESAVASASAVDGGDSADEVPSSWHALTVAFSSITAAMSAKEMLEGLRGALAPASVAYVSSSAELTHEQVAAVIAEAAAAEAAKAETAADLGAAEAPSAVEDADAGADEAARDCARDCGDQVAELSSAMSTVRLATEAGVNVTTGVGAVDAREDAA
jgi:hypothetical protein